jgi:hypothetical protein
MGEAMADRRGLMAFDSSEEATETYVGLLVGDLQIRRAIGVWVPLATPSSIAAPTGPSG